MKKSTTASSRKTTNSVFAKNYLKLSILPEFENEDLDLESVFQSNSTFLEDLATKVEPSINVNQECYTYDWNIASGVVNDWYGQMINVLPGLQDSDDFNGDIDHNPEFCLKSPKFKCGLLVDRYAEWHLELKIVELIEHGKKNKYIGVLLVLDNSANPVPINALLNVHLLATTGIVYRSAKSSMLEFGLQPPYIHSTCFPDLMTWDEFIQIKSIIIGGKADCLRIRLKMEIYGGFRQKKFKSSMMVKTAQDPLLENEFDDPILNDNANAMNVKEIRRRMKLLFTSGVGSDVSVRINGEQVVKVHREIIQVRAPGLASLIDDVNVINLDDFELFDKKTIKILMEYVYTDEIKPGHCAPRQVYQLLSAAKLFNIVNLKRDLMKTLANSFKMEDASDQLDNADTTAMRKSFESKHSAIDQKYLLAMEEFAQTAKKEQLDLTQKFTEIFRKDRKNSSNRPKAIVGPKTGIEPTKTENVEQTIEKTAQESNSKMKVKPKAPVVNSKPIARVWR